MSIKESDIKNDGDSRSEGLGIETFQKWLLNLKDKLDPI